ncbi:MAG: isoprenyl transferase [Candidatus Gastranaerophilales bacterium]|nr:isoprenyl transferase [Candidatus Gastranaerophilales bacterium]
MEALLEKDIKEAIKNTSLSHIAIIMDGNRRWAKEHLLPSMMGHKKGVDALKKVTRACDDFGVKYLTLYAFSTENWNRKKEEVDFLMDLLATTLKNELKELNENNVKMNFIGNLSQLNDNLQNILNESKEVTKNNTGVVLTVAINYGARDEIVNAIKNIVKDKVDEDEITQELVSNYLYTKNIPDPDLLIRTSGEKRISNYLLWQIAYSEIYITDTYWPEFNKDTLALAIKEFAKRQRRWGK